ncbi:MAG: D-glycero-beta-D-manno-heptose 1-phosphate adenylyltransferase [Bacteroidales bacterium]|jgi:rfaE bifunctional protein nucleotidyltransferase chain/domain|nr:D-glycero-beta-D-manno-heptose 1-phosphate adenylyltransferase [Bacteroidales bacterium]MDD2204735.1 D-glycero-beta-D-manno-heptose 1-phosphate adenylyltransferase [Bacteroidales bacterium]MDD3914158.1 D-glycero-beta-D-manno-heptose 1-phosphate adenylyltransferase [Bacteroidales bacterium]MDD4633693.1 D-glycero-beta-D-manno-heptose 1-phosphate adenylyltransferase [Bacteroidales bacterium]
MMPPKNKIFVSNELPSIASGKKLVFTNGCFDIIHAGHTDYLYKARLLGDILVVGLNSDASVKRLKGDGRPINDQLSRASVLAAMSFVDYVIIFDENTPLNLIKALKPNVLVKGGDYIADNIVGADFVKSYGGIIEIIPFLEGYSTSSIINKIRNSEK